MVGQEGGCEESYRRGGEGRGGERRGGGGGEKRGEEGRVAEFHLVVRHLADSSKQHSVEQLIVDAETRSAEQDEGNDLGRQFVRGQLEDTKSGG